MAMEFAFGLVPTSDLESFSQLIAQAEQWGFDTAFVPDQGFHRDPFVALAHLASTLSRIKLGVAVTNPYTRNPVQIARAAGALADLCQGRFILGLGAGEVGGLRDKLGAPRTPFLPVVESAIQAMRDLLDGQRVTVESPAFAIRDVSLEFECPHRIPMYLATTAPDGFRLAGRPRGRTDPGRRDRSRHHSPVLAIGRRRRGRERPDDAGHRGGDLDYDDRD